MYSLIVDGIATAVARIEEATHPKAVILPNFPRSIQLDYYSCGAKSVYSILKYFGKRCTPQSVERALRTDENGTSVGDIKHVLKDRKLLYREVHSARLVDLKRAIASGQPCLISIYDGWHYVVAFGFSKTHVFLMNPSLNPENMGSVRCAVKKKEFKKIWDRWHSKSVDIFSAFRQVTKASDDLFILILYSITHTFARSANPWEVGEHDE